MLELRIITGAATVPLFDLPALMGRTGARREIGDQIESLIAFMDDLDGDADLEDATDVEDDFHLTEGAKESWLSDGPGCPVSDPGGCQHDDREPSWTEASSQRGKLIISETDDDEEDDPAESDGDDADTTNAEDELIAGAALQYMHRGPGCPISDPDSEHDGREHEEGM